MKRLVPASALLMIIAACTAVALQQKTSPKNPPATVTAASPYEADWKKIDSLNAKGLYQSAGEAVRAVYRKALGDGNTPMLVKAVLYRSRIESMNGRDGLVNVINDLETDCRDIPFPAGPVLHSILGEVYWRYYEANRWRFLGRSETSGIVEDDIRTWDLQKILARTVYHYSLSLEPAGSLKLFPVDMFGPVLTEGKPRDSRELRPLLYDFLAHRAVDFYMNAEAAVSRPGPGFDLNRQAFFVNAEDFVTLPLSSPDTLDFHYRALKLLQELTQLHLRDPDGDRRVDVEVKRLRFLYERATVDQKDTLYIACMRSIANQEVKWPESTQAFYEIARLYAGYGGSYDYGQDAAKKPYYLRAQDVCDRAIARFPYSQGGLLCKQLKAQMALKSLHLTSAMAYTTDENLRFRLLYRNVKSVTARLVRNTASDFTETERLDEEKRLKRFSKMPLVKEWTVTLPADDDLQPHSTELAVDSLPAGAYALLLSSDPSFTLEKQCVSIAGFFVTNIAYFSRRNGDGSYLVQVNHRVSGRPLAGITVNSFSSGYDYASRSYQVKQEGTFTTDAEGRLALPALNNYKSIRLEFVNGSDRLFTRETFYQHPVQPPARAFSDQTYFFTDRAIYRPGQTVYFKGLIVQGNGEEHRIPKGQKTLVQFFDANGELVSKQDLVTNEYGTFQGTFTAPSGVLTGTMRIGNESGTVSFSVEEYKRPKFEVTFTPPGGALRLGQDVRITGKATMYSGNPVDNAKVRWQVRRRMRWIDWPWWKPAIAPAVQEVVLAQGTAQTDARGEFTVTFEARPDFSIDESSDPAFVFTATADVTDLNGETRSGQQEVEISYQAVRLSATLSDRVQKENAPVVIVRSLNSAGQREPVKVDAVVYRLQQPEKPQRRPLWEKPDKPLLSAQEEQQRFPLDSREDLSSWKKEKAVFRQVADLNQDSVLRMDMANWPAGYYVLELHGKDRYDEGIRLTHTFLLYSARETASPVNVPLWVRAVRADAEPGGSDTVLLATGEASLTVLCEVERKNKVVKKEWLTLSKEQRFYVVPVEEADRGNIAVHFTAVKNNRVYSESVLLTVPWTNKMLDVSLKTFRDKTLPGAKETWSLSVRGKDGSAAAAEVLASMYDASLDAFLPHSWSLSLYPRYYPSLALTPHAFGDGERWLFSRNWNDIPLVTERAYDALNWFGFDRGAFHGPDRVMALSEVNVMEDSAGDDAQPAAAPLMGKVAGSKAEDKREPSPAPSMLKVRSDFRETAFFYPQLHTDEKGGLSFSFTMPEALTRWKAMFFAHTQDLSYGFAQQDVITQKKLMVFTNAPRFVREGDTLELPVKISSMSDSVLAVTATIRFEDALTGRHLPAILLPGQQAQTAVSLPARLGALVTWKVVVPHGLQALSLTATAEAAGHSDGETMTIPVLPDRMLVTETLPFSLRPKQDKTVTFDRLLHNESPTLQHQSFTLEYTGNPAWYAVQALPYLMEYPYDCSEQVFSRYYANALAGHIVQSRPSMKAVFDRWKEDGKGAFLSALEKNQELKGVLLEESPWVKDALDEKEQKQRIALLFDLNTLSAGLDAALAQLIRQQSPNGGWPWFPGLPDDRYITQYIVEGMGHLAHLHVLDPDSDAAVASMIRKAVAYCDQRMAEDYQLLLRQKPDMSKPWVSDLQLHYLYARSFFPALKPGGDADKAMRFYTGQAKKFWLDHGIGIQAMIALTLQRQDDASGAGDIIKSLRERSKTSEEMGMYWPENESGFSWSQATVENQALLIEAFGESGSRQEVDDMKLWLLKNKQTTNWKTTKATAEACYALLLTGSDWLAAAAAPAVTVGSLKLDLPPAEAGTGYFKKAWTGSDVSPAMATVRVKNNNDAPAWGALYWQYFEALDNITSDGRPLRIARRLFVERRNGNNTVSELITDTTRLVPGDRVKVRVIIQTDRDMEYVHVKDLRAAGFEPENVLSGFRYQDGLGYYESTRDAATNIFISFLPKGMYVFEYNLRAAQAGSYSNGIATIQCMYAPEFSAHSDGLRVKIGEK